MTKKASLIGLYLLAVVLIGFYVLSASRLAHVVATNMPKVNPYLNVVIVDLVGVLPLVYLPFLWSAFPSRVMRVLLVVCILVLALGITYINIQAWR